METSMRTYDDFPGPATTIDDAHLTVAAAFSDRENAHDAAHELHDEGFPDTWIGIARADDGEYGYADTAQEEQPQADPQTRIESDNWFMRFFGEGDESLADALVRHGVSDADARAAGTLEPHAALLTVDGTNHPELAAHLIVKHGGRLITRGFGATGYGTAGAYGAGVAASDSDRAVVSTAAAVSESAIPAKPAAEEDVSPRAFPPEGGSELSGDGWPNGFSTTRQTAVTADATSVDDDERCAAPRDDYGRYRGGTPIDESTRLQLREERLRIDKSRIARGDATISNRIVSEQHAFDVPMTREELFVERRPVRSAEPTGDVPIGQNTEIRIPLMQERVVVTELPVVTEEIIVGNRQVTDTGHIAETTREETLQIAGVDALPDAPISR